MKHGPRSLPRQFAVFLVMLAMVTLTGSTAVLATSQIAGAQEVADPTDVPDVDPTDVPDVDPTDVPDVDPTEEPVVPTEEPVVPTDESSESLSALGAANVDVSLGGILRKNARHLAWCTSTSWTAFQIWTMTRIHWNSREKPTKAGP